MHKIGIIGAITSIFAVIVLIGVYYSHMGGQPQSAAHAAYESATYMIDGRSVTLVNGVARVPAAPGSASMVTYRYFGNDAKGDLNGDGIEDDAFLLTQDGGGSGTFYYAAAALQAADGSYVGTNAIFLGDRIAPQTTEIRDGQIVVNFAERKPGEAFTERPSVGVSRYFKIMDAKLVSASEVRH